MGNHEKAPTGHGASKLSVAPWVVKTKMAPRGPGKDARGSWSHEALGGSMCRQDQNGPPKTWKRHPRIMEPPRPLWLHGSPGAKWHPKDSEDVNPELLEPGWMKALRRLSIWDCSLRLMWAWNSQLASKGFKSYAITMYGRPIRYRRNDNHPFQVQTDIPRF